MNKNNYLVYGGTGCTNCKQAVQLLNNKHINFVYKSFPEDYTLEELTELVGTLTRSIPQIFKLDENNQIVHIGGLMELVKHLKDN
jgi:glutaredoxin